MSIILEEIQNRTYTPTLITVWLGTNDHALANGSNFERHVPQDQYKTNLIQIIRRFQAVIPDSNFLLVTPAHIDDSVREKYAAQRSDDRRGIVDWTNAVAGIYAGACVETATNLSIPILDLYTYFNAMPESTRNALLADGVHFNSEGNKVLSEQWIGKIESEFPEIANTLNIWAYPPSKKWVKEDPWTPDSATESSG